MYMYVHHIYNHKIQKISLYLNIGTSRLTTKGVVVFVLSYTFKYDINLDNSRFRSDITRCN